MVRASPSLLQGLRENLPLYPLPRGALACPCAKFQGSNKNIHSGFSQHTPAALDNTQPLPAGELACAELEEARPRADCRCPAGPSWRANSPPKPVPAPSWGTVPSNKELAQSTQKAPEKH